MTKLGHLKRVDLDELLLPDPMSGEIRLEDVEIPT